MVSDVLQHHQLSKTLTLPLRSTPAARKILATLISDADTTTHKLSGKGTRRHRMNYEQQTVLLTPPLTPSSSIRTTGSVESGSNSYKAVVDPGNEAGLANTEGCFVDSDTVSTRFLLIRNVSRKVSSEGLQFAILRSLSAATSPHSTAIPPTSPNRTTGPPNHLPIVDTIKGVLLRYHESHGIAILAFYDVRQAKLAQALLSTPTIGTLSDCVGDGGNYNGQRWLDCAFVTPTDLAQMVGKSSFLAETQASFLFAVEVDHTTADSDKNARREINISALTDLLGTYGGLRSFTIVQETPQLPSRKVFHVEYYDVRDANTALAALEGQVLFGMHLSPLRA
ncbi:hypothetical protein C8J57DRAFT_586235 [Mycena rebaudengoi]|nr:hypothetical protein C8J57DRAFT_586235 [Mycena rebaudengoi]